MLNNIYGHRTVEKTIKLIKSLFYVNFRRCNDPRPANNVNSLLLSSLSTVSPLFIIALVLALFLSFHSTS